MKPFNLELARKGNPVCTRDGQNARIVCFDYTGRQPIISLIAVNNGSELIGFHNNDGTENSLPGHPPSSFDLMMKSRTAKRWMYISAGDIENGRIKDTALYAYRPETNFGNWQLIEFEVEI